MLARVALASAALVAGCGGTDAASDGAQGPGDEAMGEGGGDGAGGAGGGEGGGGAVPYDGPPLPWPFVPFPAAPDVPEGQAALGRWLLYDPILSADLATACVTCHSEIWGLGDGLPTSVGVHGEGPVGPGRTGPTTTARNAPTLWNVAFRQELFWDGRARTLEDQALMPLRDPIELGKDPEAAAADLSAIPEYVELFREAFPGEDPPISPATIARALAAVQRTFVSRRAPYDQYVRGDEGAMDPETRRGMDLFAEAGCHTCHAPPLFASDGFAARREVAEDPGRAGVTGQAEDRGAFRVPTLRNVRDTEPYFHDGSVASLEDAVDREVDRQIQDGQSRHLDASERAAIVRFLEKALQDGSASPERPGAVPSGLPVPEDGFRIPR